MDAKKWEEICEYAAWFYQMTAVIRIRTYGTLGQGRPVPQGGPADRGREPPAYSPCAGRRDADRPARRAARCSTSRASIPRAKFVADSRNPRGRDDPNGPSQGSQAKFIRGLSLWHQWCSDRLRSIKIRHGPVVHQNERREGADGSRIAVNLGPTAGHLPGEDRDADRHGISRVIPRPAVVSGLLPGVVAASHRGPAAARDRGGLRRPPRHRPLCLTRPVDLAVPARKA